MFSKLVLSKQLMNTDSLFLLQTCPGGGGRMRRRPPAISCGGGTQISPALVPRSYGACSNDRKVPLLCMYCATFHLTNYSFLLTVSTLSDAASYPKPGLSTEN